MTLSLIKVLYLSYKRSYVSLIILCLPSQAFDTLFHLCGPLLIFFFIRYHVTVKIFDSS